MSGTIPWWLAEASPEPLPRRPLDRAPAGEALTRPGSLRLAADEEELEQIRLEYAALRADGFAAEWRDADALAPGLRRAFLGGIFRAHDGSLQPARFVLDLATRVVEAGVEVRERTQV